MNNIVFDTPFNRERFIRSNKVFWEYSWRKRKKAIVQWALVAIVFIALGLWVGVKEGNMNNPYIDIGIVLFCIAVVMGLNMFFSRRRHKAKVEETATSYEKEKSEQVITLSEEGVGFRDFQTRFSLKWSCFKNFARYKEHILLIPNNPIVGGGLVINKQEDPEKYEQAIALLEEKLMEA